MAGKSQNLLLPRGEIVEEAITVIMAYSAYLHRIKSYIRSIATVQAGTDVSGRDCLLHTLRPIAFARSLNGYAPETVVKVKAHTTVFPHVSVFGKDHAIGPVIHDVCL